jgi:hypothetical protein
MTTGMQIDFSDLQPENATSSIRVSLERHSNDTISSEVQPEKHRVGRICTNVGMQIDFSDLHPENARSPI